MHIFNLLGLGPGNTQIAHSLHLSVKTIESHRENIKRKLDLSCSRDLIACAKKYVEETFLPAAKGAFAIRAKRGRPLPRRLTRNLGTFNKENRNAGIEERDFRDRR